MFFDVKNHVSSQDFPDYPVIKTLCPSARAMNSGSTPGQRTKILHACCMAQPQNKHKDMKTLKKKIMYSYGNR